MFYFGKKSRQILNDKRLDNRLKILSEKALKETKVDFSIIGGFRTAEEQNELFKKGFSEADGYRVISAHQRGLAIDVIPYVKDKDIWDTQDLEVKALWYEVHRAFLRASRLLDIDIILGLTFNIGGDYDYCHIELKSN